LVFGEMTTGASNDLEKVTELARAMVTRYGMSDKLGPMTFGQKEELVFLGKEIGEQRDYSDAVAEQIDEEVRRIVHTAYENASQVLAEHRGQLDAVAEKLMEVETLDAVAFRAIVEGHSVPEEQAPGGAVSSSFTGREQPSPAAPGPKLEMPPHPAPA
jgi:cell division protease FtsH